MSNTIRTELASARRRPTSPGWPEVFAGALAYAVSFLLVWLLLPLVTNDAVAGIAGLFVSGLMGLVALAVAALIRIRGLSAFGIRRAKIGHLLIGAALGIPAYILGRIASFAWVSATGAEQNLQSSYNAAAASGLFALIITLIAGAVITPIGEEAFFRGVIANVLLKRCGVWIGILGSAAIFAIAHGFNPIFPAAFVVGVLTAVLFRWSGSIWPGVLLHSVNNATAFLLPVIAAAATL